MVDDDDDDDDDDVKQVSAYVAASSLEKGGRAANMKTKNVEETIYW